MSKESKGSLLKLATGSDLTDVKISGDINVNTIVKELQKTYTDASEKCKEARGFIINRTKKNVRFKVYDADDFFINTWWFLQWLALKAHQTDAQPNEKVTVHGGKTRSSNEDLKIWVEGNSAKIYYNVRIGHVYTWDGKRMEEVESGQESGLKLL